MHKTIRTSASIGLRLFVCVLAVWFVSQGVAWNDTVQLVDGRVLPGTVEAGADTVHLVDRSGGRIALSASDIADDGQGGMAVAFGLRSSWRDGNKRLLLLAMLIHLPVGLLQAVRFRWLLAVQTIRISMWDSIKLSYAGNFLNFAAPFGANAGDVFKAYFVTLHSHAFKTEAATTVVLDRIIGLGTLIIVVAAITLAAGEHSRLVQFRSYALSMIGVGTVCIILYVSPFVRRAIVSPQFARWVPLSAHVLRMDRASRTLLSRPALVLGACMVTVVLQTLAMGAYFVVAAAIGLKAELTNIADYYAYFATGAVIQSLPGPPQGLGTVELAYRYFFAPFGSPSQIVCMALCARLVVLACSIPGAWVALCGSYRPRTALATPVPEAMAMEQIAD